MKTRILTLIMCMLGALAVQAQLTIPDADGSDGALVIDANTVIDLSQAVSGPGIAWNTDNTANAGLGIYDPEKWAIVFKYSSVSVAAGTTLSFKNHPSRAPVVWLVSGDVTIEGAVSLNGARWQAAPVLTEPGPGGFRGATGSYSSGALASAGFGPGGGSSGTTTGTGGSYSTKTGGPVPYGNPSLVPLIGGSGGAADRELSYYRSGGGGGGGAILIASSGTTTINGSVTSNGGAGYYHYDGTDTNTGGGSGGGIRIVTNSLDGTGIVETLAGAGWQVGGLGRVRIERVINNNTIQVTPDPSLVPLTGGDTALLWPPADAPTVKILSIGGSLAPDDPRADFGTTGADVVLPELTSVPVVVETVGVEEASVVEVRLTPRSNANRTIVTATSYVVMSTNPLTIHWTADVPVNDGYSAVQAKVVRP